MTWLAPAAVWVGGELVPGLAVQITSQDGRGTIRSVGPLPPDAERVVQLPRRALLPGFVNAHSHAFQRGLRGWVQHTEGSDSFWTWRERMYALATRLDPDGIEAISTLAFAEMVRAGFTTVGEFHYVHHQADGTPYADPDELAMRVVNAAQRVGLRIVLLRVAYGRAGHGVAPNPRQARFIDPSPDHALEAVARLGARGVIAGLAPHSVRACSADWLRAFAQFQGPLHMHVDEQPAEIAQCLAEHSRRPVELCADLGLLGPRFTAVHLTHANDAEIALLEAQGGTVCACPTTELDLGDGFLPTWKINAPICIGSDSHAAIDPFAELRALDWHARAVLGRRNATAHEGPDGLANVLLERGIRHGAESLGVGARKIAAGEAADLVAIDLSRLEFAAARALPAIVFNASPAAVSDVFVGGRHVVREGRVPGAEAIANDAERAIRRLAAG